MATRGSHTCPQNEVGGIPKLLDISYPTENPYPKDSQCVFPQGLGVGNDPVDASCAPQKRFLIFDQSGKHIRLFVIRLFSPQNQNIVSKTRASGENVPAQVDQQLLVKDEAGESDEKWDENHFSDGEGESLDESKEINALLYSDGDDDDDDDEVTSAVHTAFSIEKGLAKYELLKKNMGEVVSCDGSPKRRKLLDGGFKKSSLVVVESPVKRADLCSYENDDIDFSKREES